MKTIALIAALITLGGAVFAQTSDSPPTPQVEITFIGHACFQITTTAGTKIVCDPSAVEGYKFPDNFTADILTVSHQHFDHNNKAAVKGSPLVLEGMLWTNNDARFHKFAPIDTLVNDVHLRTVECHHFPPKLSPVNNAIFVYAFGSITVVHLGDIGVLLTDEQAKAVGRVDILMIPTGGEYTLNLTEVDQQIAQLKPRVVIPMHYATDVVDFVPNSVEDFLKGKTNINRVGGSTWTFDPKALPSELTYLTLEYLH